MSTYVFQFSEGNKDQKDLLGGKGANLAEMVNMGWPVPPGCTISTERVTWGAGLWLVGHSPFQRNGEWVEGYILKVSGR